MDLIEAIVANGHTLACIIRGDVSPPRTQFLTPDEFALQVGFVVYAAGGEVERHTHRPLERHLVGTSEVLVVKHGRCELDVYDDDHRLVATRELRTGDVMIMVGGGHGFRM